MHSRREILSQHIIRKFWLVRFLDWRAQEQVSREVLHGMLLVLHIMKKILKNHNIPAVTTIYEMIMEMDEHKRAATGVTSFFLAGGTVQEVVRGVVEKARHDQWDNVPAALGINVAFDNWLIASVFR